MKDFLSGTVTPTDWAAAAGIIGLAAAIVAAFWFLVHEGQQEKIAVLRANDAIIVTDLKLAQQLDSQIEKLREETAKVEGLVLEFEERLPSTREIPTLLKEFEGMASSDNLDVELSPLGRTSDQRKEIIPYRIVARGSFHQVASFLNRLERFKRYLKVSDLAITRESNGLLTTATFTLNTYRFLQSSTGDV